jgi:hypothetical protein
MLSQHLITRPVFDALFQNYAFTQHNPVSLAMQKMLDTLDDQALEKETDKLDKFYASVNERASGIDNAEGRQRVVIELKLWKKGSLDTLITDGLTQTADYADKAGADEAYLIVFDRRPNIAWDERIWQRQESAGARRIAVWGM